MYWQTAFDFPENLTEGTTEPAANGSVTFTYNATTQVPSVNIKLTKGS